MEFITNVIEYMKEYKDEITNIINARYNDNMAAEEKDNLY